MNFAKLSDFPSESLRRWYCRVVVDALHKVIRYSDIGRGIKRLSAGKGSYIGRHTIFIDFALVAYNRV